MEDVIQAKGEKHDGTGGKSSLRITPSTSRGACPKASRQNSQRKKKSSQKLLKSEVNAQCQGVSFNFIIGENDTGYQFAGDSSLANKDENLIEIQGQTSSASITAADHEHRETGKSEYDADPTRDRSTRTNTTPNDHNVTGPEPPNSTWSKVMARRPKRPRNDQPGVQFKATGAAATA